MSIVAASQDHEHHLLYIGFEEPPTDAKFATVTELPAGHVRRIAAVRRHTTRLDPDVVHLHSSWAGVYGRVRRLPVGYVVYQPHCFAFEDTTRPRVQRAVFRRAERFLGRNMNALAAVSERERLLGNELAPNARVVLVPNRSDLEYVEVRPISANGARRVVMSGEIRAQKDPTMFAQIAEAASGLGLEFVWIGDGDQSQRALLEAAGVEVTGWVDKHEMQVELDRAALYLHTARYEGFPLSVLDAAARKVPLLIRRSPAFEDIGLSTFETVAEAAGLLAEHVGDRSSLPTDNVGRVRALFAPERVASAALELYEHGVGSR